MGKYTKKQFALISVFMISNFFSALSYSLQAPFFPQEAEKKGATPSQYGLVFGVFELVLLFLTPFCGNYVSELGPKFMATAGLFMIGGASVLFGQLDKFTDTNTFIGFAFAIRIAESVGLSGFIISLFTFIAMVFPDNVGSTFANIETFFGLGMIIGPTVGGALYGLGGFALPFEVLGSTLLVCSLLLFFILPPDKNEEVVTRASYWGALKIGPIRLVVLTIAATAFGLGLLDVGLAPHLALLQMDPFKIGLIFAIDGGCYAIFSPIFGKLIDNGLPPRIGIIGGEVSIILSFFLLGPAPYLPLDPYLWLIIVSLVLQGVGMGAIFVGTFVEAQNAATDHGMPDNLSTFGVISGLWMSSISLGSFTGPSVSGYVIEVAGFRWATQVCFLIHLIVIVIFSVFTYRSGFKFAAKKGEEEMLVKDDFHHYGSSNDGKSENKFK